MRVRGREGGMKGVRERVDGSKVGREGGNDLKSEVGIMRDI